MGGRLRGILDAMVKGWGMIGQDSVDDQKRLKHVECLGARNGS